MSKFYIIIYLLGLYLAFSFSSTFNWLLVPLVTIDSFRHATVKVRECFPLVFVVVSRMVTYLLLNCRHGFVTFCCVSITHITYWRWLFIAPIIVMYIACLCQLFLLLLRFLRITCISHYFSHTGFSLVVLSTIRVRHRQAKCENCNSTQASVWCSCLSCSLNL